MLFPVSPSYSPHLVLCNQSGEAPEGVDFSSVHMNIGAAKKLEMRERLKDYLEKRLQDSATEFVDTMQKENEDIGKMNNIQQKEDEEQAKVKVSESSSKKFPLKDKESSNKDIVHEWSTWQALIDNKRGQIYYYNKETYESSWDRPNGFPDFKLSASRRLMLKEQNIRYMEWQTDASRGTDEEEGATVESNASTDREVDDVQGLPIERMAEPMLVQNANNVGEAFEGPTGNDANQPPPSLPIVQQGDWSAYFDIKSGLVFYFNEITSETSWDPPFDKFPRIVMDAGGLGPKVLDSEEAGNISMERALGYIGVDEMAEALKWEEAKKKERARKAAKRAKEAEAKGGSTMESVSVYEAAKQAEVEKLVQERKVAAEQKAKEDADTKQREQQQEESERLRLQKERIEQVRLDGFVPKQPVRPKEDPTINAVTISTMVSPLKTRTLYDILQSKSTASRSELKRAYISLAKETHPDALLQNGMVNDTETELRFIEISQAWKVLGDTTSRRRYDRELQAKGLSSKAGNMFENWVMEAAKAMDEVLAVAEDSIES